jgi:hypothetical protein
MRFLYLIATIVLTGCAATSTTDAVPGDTAWTFCRSPDAYALSQAVARFNQCPSKVLSRPSYVLSRYDVPMATSAVLSVCAEEADAVEALLLTCAQGNEVEAAARFKPIYRSAFRRTEAAIIEQRAR